MGTASELTLQRGPLLSWIMYDLQRALMPDVFFDEKLRIQL
jgi:hypothetical protein